MGNSAKNISWTKEGDDLLRIIDLRVQGPVRIVGGLLGPKENWLTMQVLVDPIEVEPG